MRQWLARMLSGKRAVTIGILRARMYVLNQQRELLASRLHNSFQCNCTQLASEILRSKYLIVLRCEGSSTSARLENVNKFINVNRANNKLCAAHRSIKNEKCKAEISNPSSQ